VVGAINLRDDGSVADITDLRIEARRGKITKLIPTRKAVPQPPKRTVAVASAFLCDNAGYLLGLDSKDNPERARSQFEAARAVHEAVLSDVDDPMARAIVAHFKTWTPETAAKHFDGKADELKTGWLVFQRAKTGDYAHELPALRAAWAKHAGDDEDFVLGQCLVTGDADVPLPLIHPAIKGISGAQSSGAALVSFNLPAFTSFGKEQNLNAPIGAAAAFAYTTALNHLLRPESPQKIRIGDTTAVFWADADTPAESELPLYLAPPPTDDQAVVRQLQERLGRIATGRWTTDPEFENADKVHFFVLGLAPNAARLQIRFFLTDTLREFLLRLQQHCRDILFEDPGDGTIVPTLWRLADDLLPKDRDGKTRRSEGDTKKVEKLQGELLRAVLAGQDFSQAMLPTVLGRLRTDGHATRARLGLVKACLNRHARAVHGAAALEIKMELDDQIDDPGYLLGRLFAVLENVQVLSRGKSDSPTIRDRFASAASVTPRAVFPHLLGLSQSHARKAKRDMPGIAHNRARQIENLGARFDASVGGFPSQLDLKQQGLFFIGYYQQRQSFFKKGEARETESDTRAPDDSEE
jgi:CRISPR-associated protein Csd1